MRTLLISLSFLLLPACQRAGNPTVGAPHGAWVSSGGELIKDSHNPWWLKNVSEVKYWPRREFTVRSTAMSNF